MSRETRTGILTVIVIAISIWGYKFIKGQNLLSSQQFFYAEYDDIGGMQTSSPVLYQGFQVGTITDIFPKPDAKQQKVVVEIEVRKDFRIPKNTVAEIRQTIMGDKSIALVFNQQCVAADCAVSGDNLTGVYKSIPNSIMTPEELRIYMGEVSEGLKTVTNGLNDIVNDPNNAIGKTISDLQATMANMRTTTNLVNKQLRQNGKVDDILKNVNNLTASIDEEQIKSILGNTNSFTGKMSKVDFEGISNNTEQTMADAKAAIAKLTETMNKAEGTINSLNTLLEKINSGQGSLGKIVHDDALYDEIKQAAKSTNILMTDLQQRPQRYIPFKSSRKIKKIDRKNPLVMPEEGKKN